jgi:chaperonin GroEL
VVNKVKSESKSSLGFNAANDQYVDMLEAGIIDPTKVSRCALQNASSVAGLMLTTQVMITDLPEDKKEPMGGHGHNHGMEGMY